MNIPRRRRDRARMKRKARRLYEGCALPEKYADHLTACSCLMCGNPRKWFKQRSFQERRQAG